MKKSMSIFLAAALLGACSEGEDTLSQEEEAAVEEEAPDSVATDEELAEISEEELNNSELITDLSGYEEFETQEVFDPEQYDSHLVEDSYAQRVFVFAENNEQLYKTIYEKEANRFKVIDLLEREVLLNTPI